jgi:signal transduction histidine kinase
VAAYRIATEALNNVARHATARHCRVVLGTQGLGTSEEALVVEVEDDGVGLARCTHIGVGLTSMRERTTELGGSWSATTVPTGGTRICARIPLVAA